MVKWTREKAQPFVVHGNWTGDGKHHVTYYATTKSKTVTLKRFSSYKAAKAWADNLARKRGCKTVLVKTGTGYIKSPKVTDPKKRKPKKKSSAWVF